MAITRTRKRRERAASRRRRAAGEPTASRPPIVELNEATVVYRGGHVGLERASLDVERGEFLFMVGPTGCGKSTFIKLLPNRTAYDNVAYALRVTGATRAEIRERVPDILRLVGLASKIHNLPGQLSGGEQQRVSIARAFVSHPPLLLADEPTGNLDPATSIGIMQLLYRINRTGTTVIVVTHDGAMVDKMRRRVVELYEGRVIRDEAAGLYAQDESTREFGVRVRSELGIGEGHTNGEAGAAHGED